MDREFGAVDLRSLKSKLLSKSRGLWGPASHSGGHD